MDTGPPWSAEDAAHELAADGLTLDQARALVRDYLDDVSEQVGTSVHPWGLDAADLADIRQTGRGHAADEAERREQLARWHADDQARTGVDEQVLDAISTRGCRADDHADPDRGRRALVAAMGHALERGMRKVQRLDEDVRRLAQDVIALHDHPGPPADDAEAAVRAWLLTDEPAQAVQDLTDLAGWVNAVYLRYPDAALSSCWLWHPHVIEELWWLRARTPTPTTPRPGPGYAWGTGTTGNVPASPCGSGRR